MHPDVMFCSDSLRSKLRHHRDQSNRLAAKILAWLTVSKKRSISRSHSPWNTLLHPIRSTNGPNGLHATYESARIEAAITQLEFIS
jgi:hypothetical protein